MFPLLASGSVVGLVSVHVIVVCCVAPVLP